MTTPSDKVHPAKEEYCVNVAPGKSSPSYSQLCIFAPAAAGHCLLDLEDELLLLLDVAGSAPFVVPTGGASYKT